jgi:hydrogenase expression/formation protein HypC
MCLAIPMRVVSVEGNMGRVDASGARIRVALDLVEDVAPGDYVLVHAGYAISSLSAEEAEESLEILRRLAASREE